MIESIRCSDCVRRICDMKCYNGFLPYMHKKYCNQPMLEENSRPSRAHRPSPKPMPAIIRRLPAPRLDIGNRAERLEEENRKLRNSLKCMDDVRSQLQRAMLENSVLLEEVETLKVAVLNSTGYVDVSSMETRRFCDQGLEVDRFAINTPSPSSKSRMNRRIFCNLQTPLTDPLRRGWLSR